MICPNFKCQSQIRNSAWKQVSLVMSSCTGSSFVIVLNGSKFITVVTHPLSYTNI